MSEIRVLIVDDHALVRGSVGEWLRREPGIVLAGCAGTGDEALAKMADLRPDVVLMDIDMPGMIAFEAVRRMGERFPRARVIFLSGHKYDRYIQEAIELKAWGYLTKREPPERVVAAVREVAAGGVCFSEEVRARIVVDAVGAKLPGSTGGRASRRAGSAGASPSPGGRASWRAGSARASSSRARPSSSVLKSRLATLRPRELETLRYLARGLTKKEIAEQMFLSIKTIDTYTTRLMEALDIHDRVELARFAIREGLAEP